MKIAMHGTIYENRDSGRSKDYLNLMAEIFAKAKRFENLNKKGPLQGVNSFGNINL